MKAGADEAGAGAFHLRHILLTARYSVRHALRGGSGVLYFVIVMSVGLYAADAVLNPVESALRESSNPERALDGLEDFAEPFAAFVLEEYPVTGSRDASEKEAAQEEAEERAEEWAAGLLNDKPSVLSALFMGFVLMLPFVVCLGSFNQVSGDMGSRGLRFVLLRTRRSSLLLGRFLGTAVFVAGVQLITVAIVIGYVATRMDVYENGALIAWGLQGVLCLTLLTLPYVALATLISTYTMGPFVALILNQVTVGGVWLGAVILRGQWDYFHYLKWLLPLGIQTDLFALEAGKVAAAAAACVGYTVVFLFLARRKFEIRDL